jgi:hypothetical protein
VSQLLCPHNAALLAVILRSSPHKEAGDATCLLFFGPYIRESVALAVTIFQAAKRQREVLPIRHKRMFCPNSCGLPQPDRESSAIHSACFSSIHPA